MTIIKLAVTMATLTITYDQLLALPQQQWLWERGLIGGIYGLCVSVAVCGGLLMLERAR